MEGKGGGEGKKTETLALENLKMCQRATTTTKIGDKEEK